MADPWQHFRRMTPARIAVGRSGGSIPTGELLNFQLAHARAQDAVQTPLDTDRIVGGIRELGADVIRVSTRAAGRHEYLTRPDRGRRLSDASQAALRDRRTAPPAELAIVIADGLSAAAVHAHAAALLQELLLQLDVANWRLAPIVVAEFGRVALQDDVGAALGCSHVLTLLGERPGLSSPDSLGAYLVHAPKLGNTDAHRNCISNIRSEGLPPAAAARVLTWLLNESRRLKISGVSLKLDASVLALATAGAPPELVSQEPSLNSE